MSPTPSTNSALSHRTGGFESLAAGLDYAALGQTGANFFSARGELELALPYRELRARAVDMALRLNAMGLPRGTRIALVADTTHDDAFTAAFNAFVNCGELEICYQP